MKKVPSASAVRWLAPILALVLVGLASAQDARARFLELTDQWAASYNDGDAAGVAALYAEDAVFINTSGLTFTGSGAIGAYIQALLQAGLVHFEAESFDIGVDSVLGYNYGSYAFQHESGAVIRGHFMTVNGLVDGEWKILRHISSPIEQQE